MDELHKSSELKTDLKKGTYAAVNGPNLETKAEYRYLKILEEIIAAAAKADKKLTVLLKETIIAL